MVELPSVGATGPKYQFNDNIMLIIESLLLSVPHKRAKVTLKCAA